MGFIYGITWYAMSLAMPCMFSLNAVIKTMSIENRDNQTEKQRAAQLFWLKYWVCFAYYYVLESILDCIIAWLPLYNELKLLVLVMASPITPFVAIRAFAGVPIEDLDINRSPVETVFQAVCLFNSSSRDGARSIGLNRDALRQNVSFLTQNATQFIKMAGVALSYGMTMVQNLQASSPPAPHQPVTESESAAKSK